MFFLRCTISLYLIIGAHTLLIAMDREQQIAELLEQYPAPNISNGWLANWFGSNQEYKLVHVHAIKQAELEHDFLKAQVLTKMYRNYLKPPNLWGLEHVPSIGRYFEKPDFIDEFMDVLESARQAGRDDLVALLLRDGAPLFRTESNFEKPDDNKFDGDLKSAIQAGRDDLVALLLAHGASFRNDIDDDSNPLWADNSLHILIDAFPLFDNDQAGYEYIVKLLIDRGIRLNEHYWFGHHGWTFPLKEAFGNDSLVRILIKHGADIDFLDRDGYTLLNNNRFITESTRKLAYIHRSERLLSFGADVNYGYSALPGLYCGHNGREMLSFLLAHGAAIDGKDKQGKTMFHKAFWMLGKVDDLKLFLHQAPFTKTKTELKSSRNCIIAALCLFNRLRLSRDMRINLLNYLSCEVFSISHCRFLLHHGVGLQKLAPHCQMAWLKTLYQELAESVKANCLKEIVSLVTAHRLGKMKILFESQWLQDMYAERHPYNPNEHVILKLLDPNNVEQHRSSIEKKVCEDIRA